MYDCVHEIVTNIVNHVCVTCKAQPELRVWGYCYGEAIATFQVESFLLLVVIKTREYFHIQQVITIKKNGKTVFFLEENLVAKVAPGWVGLRLHSRLASAAGWTSCPDDAAGGLCR